MSRARVIAHADMDAFFASVEQLDHPELRGRPVLVGGGVERGVVCAASYEARPFGIGSAMPMAQARRRCPEAVVLPPRFSRYVEVSGQIMEVFGRFSPLIEPLSLDEAFIDLTGTAGILGAPEIAGRQIKAGVREATGGLTVSVGIANTKFLAKVASDFDKPDGLTLVPPDEVIAFLHPMPVSRLWGVGPKAKTRFEKLGLRTIGDVARADREALERELGSLGTHVWRLSHNDDDREVIPHRGAKSVGSEQTLSEDVVGAPAITPYLRRSADEIGRRLRKDGLRAGAVRVKLKTRTFRLVSHQARLPAPTDVAATLFAAAERLLARFELREPVRLVGLTAFDLLRGEPARQLLFPEPGEARQRRLEQTLDQVRGRFGLEAVRRAADLDGPDVEDSPMGGRMDRDP